MSTEIEKFMCLLPRAAFRRGQDPTRERTISERIASLRTALFISHPARSHRSLVKLAKICRGDRTTEARGTEKERIARFSRIMSSRSCTHSTGRQGDRVRDVQSHKVINSGRRATSDSSRYRVFSLISSRCTNGLNYAIRIG